MTGWTRAALLALAMGAAPGPAPAQGAMTGAAETYELLFRGGTLDALPRAEPLVYDRAVESRLAPEAAARETGTLRLGFEGGTPEMVGLRFEQGERFRGVGRFPASVGNPVVMYFVETVARDMAEAAGGSPFYIRNRIKDALVAPAAMEQATTAWDGAEVAATTVTLTPFAGDPNAARMQGFDALELRVTMSDAVPGWYRRLEAVVPGPDGEAGPVYSSVIELEAGE